VPQEISLGQRIREMRMRKGMTQIDLAKGLCTPSMISQVESDRARPSYKLLIGISERLGVPLEELLAPVELSLDFVSTFKMAQAMAAAGEYTVAIPQLLNLLENPRPHVSATDIQFLLGTCCLHTNELRQAEKIFSEIEETAILRQDDSLLASALHQLGRIDLKSKKHHLAVYRLEKALRHAEKIETRDNILISNILTDLGRAHLQLGQVSNAIKCYDQASLLLEQLKSWRDLAELYLQMSKAYKACNDHEKAIAYADRATALYTSFENLFLKHMIECETAVVIGANGQEEKAIEVLRSSIEKLQGLQVSEAAGNALLEIAKIQIQCGDLDGAANSCDQARLLLPETHLYRGRVNRLYGQIALKRGDAEEAIHFFEKAVDFLKDAGDFREWEETVCELAHLYLEAGDAKHAFQLIHDGYTAARKVMQERGIYL
jgi:tetratricopeptide (TPR) repeat protein